MKNENIQMGVLNHDSEEGNSHQPIVKNRIKYHYNSLDGFRAIAITLVIISHLNFYSENKVAKLFSGGFGVTIFFAISGFLITSLLLGELAETGNISLPKFYARRALRIFPVAYLFIVILLIVNNCFSMHISSSEFYSASLFITNTSLLTAASTNIQHYWSYAGHFWSLSVEEQFYLFFPLVLKRNTKAYLWLIGIMIIMIPPCVYLDVKQLYFFKNPAIHHLVEFTRSLTSILIGSFAGLLYFNKRLVIPTFRNSTLLTISLFFLAGAVAGNFIKIIPTSFSPTISSILVVCMILINLDESENLVFKVLNSKPLKFVALLSYSLYIWQQIFTNNVPWKGLFPYSESHLLNFSALLLVSLTSYYAYERYFLKLKKHFN